MLFSIIKMLLKTGYQIIIYEMSQHMLFFNSYLYEVSLKLYCSQLADADAMNLNFRYSPHDRDFHVLMIHTMSNLMKIFSFMSIFKTSCVEFLPFSLKNHTLLNISFYNFTSLYFWHGSIFSLFFNSYFFCYSNFKTNCFSLNTEDFDDKV